jgi:uncharacterized protein DUF4430
VVCSTLGAGFASNDSSRRATLPGALVRVLALVPAVALILVLALVVAGCGLGAGRTPGAVQLEVTRDFGASVLPRARALEVSGQETVMSLLMRNYAVATRSGGAFVQSIDGLAGGRQAGRPVDWFYYDNGVQVLKRAAATNVHRGDRIWWDRHDWSQAENVPAVVGSFPAPFLDGIEGKRYPLRVECTQVAGPACNAVRTRLRRLGVPVALAGLGGGAPQTLRLLVGPWSLIGGALGGQSIARGPRASGVYAVFSGDGRTLTPLDQDGAPRATLGAGTGLIAATRQGEDAPIWVVTGTDEAGVALAARSFDQATLHDRFAVALTPAGAVPLPQERSGAL